MRNALSAERDGEFERQLRVALDSAEIRTAVQQDGAPSVGALEDAATARKADITIKADAAEKAYAAAAAVADELAQAGRRSRRAAAVARGLLVLLLVGFGVFFGWSMALNSAYSRGPSAEVNLWEVLFGLLFIQVLTTLPALLLGRLIWWLATFSPAVRRREPAAIRIRAHLAVWIPAVPLGVALMLLNIADIAGVVAMSASHRPTFRTDAAPGWLWLVALVVLIAYFTAVALLARWLGRDVTSVALAEQHREERLRLWRSVLLDGVLTFLRQHLGDHVVRRYLTTLDLPAGARSLRQVRSGEHHAETPADQRLAVITAGMGDGSIALSGPRGAGKSELLKQFCLRGRDNVGIVVGAPTVFDRREFFLHLFGLVCDLAETHGVVPEQARAHRQRIRYLHSDTTGTTAGLGLNWLTLGRSHSVSRDRQPFTHPELIADLRGFLGVVAQQFLQQDKRLVIGIDELDRIEPIDRARDFLNEVKAVFEVPDCLFLLSVSDEALEEADLARPGRKDAFDSAVDEVVRVEPLTYDYSVKLLDRRVIGFPRPFSALFHCLAGGVPRDLLRIARVTVTPASLGRGLTAITSSLIARDLEHGLDRPWDLVFHDTLRRIFTDDLTQDVLDRAAEPSAPGSLDALATERRRGLAEADPAWGALTAIRQTWQFPVMTAGGS
ncbi:P-loop NTPase fold protein [Amycolatopsis sp. NPDC049691]|uniref:P-loop NTPase fold protein n=1 Tax=Amycolatopsis sp. NPDC049691 TaxID=3155155 RepID=UPI00343AAD09